MYAAAEKMVLGLGSLVFGLHQRDTKDQRPTPKTKTK